jgi:hypothetical protein
VEFDRTRKNAARMLLQNVYTHENQGSLRQKFKGMQE